MTGKIKKPLLCLRLLWKEDPRGKNERKKGAVLLCGEGRAGLEAKGTLSCRCTCESQRMLSFCHFPLSREPQVGRPISRTWDHDPADTQLTEPCRCPENRTNFKEVHESSGHAKGGEPNPGQEHLKAEVGPRCQLEIQESQRCQA